MKLLLLGYGKMGKTIESIAKARGHSCGIVDPSAPEASATSLSRESSAGADVAIDFTTPDSVLGNIEAAASIGLPIVVGTTGWAHELPKVERMIQKSGSALLYGSNFSVGMNVMFKIVSEAAEKIGKFHQYDAGGFEIHHAQKKDAPSGTALTLSGLIEKSGMKKIQFSSVRTGSEPGTHTVVFDSPEDSIEITHRARSRDGFALGAVLAAEWLKDKKGVFKFEDRFEEFSV